MRFFLASFRLDCQKVVEATSDTLHPSTLLALLSVSQHSLQTHPKWSPHLSRFPSCHIQWVTSFGTSISAKWLLPRKTPWAALARTGIPPPKATPALGRWEATLPHWYSHSSYSQASHQARPETGPPHQYICNSCDQSLHTAMLRANPIRQHSCSDCSMASQPATQEMSPVHRSVSSSCGSHIRGRHNKNPAHRGDMPRMLGSSDQGRFHYRHHRCLLHKAATFKTQRCRWPNTQR